MVITREKIMKRLPAKRRREIEAVAAELIAEEMSPLELSRSRKKPPKKQSCKPTATGRSKAKAS